ncbi:glycosyltransferase family 2 protein [Paenibacillus sp. GCM10012306]|uniref:glycosyltransferase family 2 protein n=1 Tax=Paenibacillus sp. GCM10012306 TaxID=3317342 RepID=UPI00361A6E2E
MPKITVLMSAYNTRPYIKNAVESILNQTYRDFEFLIIDDCSTDGTLEYLQSLEDPRIRLIIHDSNKGLVHCLNEGLDLSTGEYIARMDSDDISAPHRFESQLRYMETHPEVGVLGTFITLFHNGELIPRPTSHEDIRCWQLFYCCVGHPTVFMRSSVLKEHDIHYNPGFTHAEDYEFWSRLSELTRIENLPEYLYSYRVHEGQISIRQHQAQRLTADRVRRMLLYNLGVFPTEEEFEIHMQFYQRTIPVHDYEGYSRALSWARKLMERNQANGIYDQETLNRILSTCFTWSETA